MPAARSSAYQGVCLKKPNMSGILNNRERGTRATSTWPSSASKIPSATMFDCLFCHHKESVVVKLDKKAHTGELTCKVCGQHFKTADPLLYDPVDVHAAWVDVCGAVKEQAEKERVGRQQKALMQRNKLMRRQQHQHKFKPQQSVKKQQQQQPPAHMHIHLESPSFSDGLDYLF